MIDLAGDRKFLKTTIYGVSGYNPHYCALCVNARLSVLSTMTKEHFGLAIALGIPLFVVVTKIDLVKENQLDRFIFIKLKNIFKFFRVLDAIRKLTECTEYSMKRVFTKEQAASCALAMPTSSIIPVFCICKFVYFICLFIFLQQM